MDGLVIGVLPENNLITEIMRSGYKFGYDEGYNDGKACAMDRLEHVARELDAAVKDMYHASSDGGSFCDICAYKNNGCDERKARDIECFEWRGVEVEG